jgi:diguanylate cyclase (GGDEF)-like protein
VVHKLAVLVGGLFGFLAVGSAPAGADSPWHNFADPVFVHTDTRELPDAAVMSVAQDGAGFIWIGTQGGLARFDGYHVRSFLPNPSDPKALPDGYLRTLLADPNGGLWVGSSSNGLVRFDEASETFHTWRPDPAGRTGPTSQSVDALLQSPDGTLWIGGDGGLSRMDTRTQSFAPVRLAERGPPPVVWSLLMDRAGTLWAGTQAGLFERPAGAGAFRRVPLLDGTHPASPAVYGIFEDHAGTLWAGSVNAIFGIDRSRRNVRVLRTSLDDRASLAPGQQWSITEIVPGMLWVGTDAAISIVDTRTGDVRRVDADPQNPSGLSGGRVVHFLHGDSGMVYIANHVGGLLEYNPLSRGLYQVPSTQPRIGFETEGAVALAAMPNDRLWVGGFRGRLADLQPRRLSSAAMHMPNRAAVQVLSSAPDGTLWIGTTDGLCRLRAGEMRATCPATPSLLAGPSIYTILNDGDGKMLIGGSTGLFAFDPVAGTAAKFPRADNFENSQVRTLFRDREHRLWVGAESGLSLVDPDERVTRFVFTPGDPNSIGPGGAATIIEDRRGRIWVGANGGPLDVLQFDPTGAIHIRRLGLIDGLPHENVDGLAEDAQGRIWASTDKGIALIDPDTLHVRALGPADGVSDNAFWAGAVSRGSDGTIFFGGLDGITVIAPGASSPWSYAPPIVATALAVGRHSMPASLANAGNASIDLPADARDISIEFSALDYSAPQSLRYEYKLDGYDADWVHADPAHRVATYTNLSPGRYTLDVRGTNRLGDWSSRPLHLSINALAPWYETWWLRSLIVALVALAAFGAERFRTAVLRRRQRELESLVGERTRELSEANTKLQELSLSDPLTGLRNRRFLDQHLESDIAITLRRFENWEAAPENPPPHDADILFFLIDLDNFKVVNDRFGHHGGDVLLMQMRERLLEVFRESDFVVRWGGDEFLTVARGSARTDAGMLAERIREAVASRPFVLGSEQTLSATVSIGFAAFPFITENPSAVSWFHVVALADHALYMAKQAGRNTWFGIAATDRTDPAVLAKQLEGSAEELVRSASLNVLEGNTTRA